MKEANRELLDRLRSEAQSEVDRTDRIREVIIKAMDEAGMEVGHIQIEEEQEAGYTAEEFGMSRKCLNISVYSMRFKYDDKPKNWLL